MTRVQSLTRVYGKRPQKQPASGAQPADEQNPEEADEEPQRPQRVVRMPYVAFLDPARQKIK